jgi:hypothetical protein
MLNEYEHGSEGGTWHVIPIPPTVDPQAMLETYLRTLFGSNIMTTAFIDRLTHRGHTLEFTGKSYRYRHRLQQDGAEER